jgi:hypothetical protein
MDAENDVIWLSRRKHFTDAKGWFKENVHTYADVLAMLAALPQWTRTRWALKCFDLSTNTGLLDCRTGHEPSEGDPEAAAFIARMKQQQAARVAEEENKKMSKVPESTEHESQRRATEPPLSPDGDKRSLTKPEDLEPPWTTTEEDGVIVKLDIEPVAFVKLDHASFKRIRATRMCYAFPWESNFYLVVSVSDAEDLLELAFCSDPPFVWEELARILMEAKRRCFDGHFFISEG